jgi:uncharacterized protein (DUF983 family)
LVATCPKCRDGKLYSGFLIVNEACLSSGLNLRCQDSCDFPKITLTLVVGAHSVFGAIMMDIATAPPYWLHVLNWPIFVFGLLPLRPLKAKCKGVQYCRGMISL